MSKVRKVSLAKLDEFFSAIAHSERLYLPVDTAAGAEYKEWAEGTKWSDALNTVRSAKDFFFPQTENLMDFKMHEKQIEIIDTRKETEDFVVFGVRACDARAFRVLDNVFLAEPVSDILAATIMMPIYGKLGDLFGRKYLFIVALSIFIVGSATCGLAPSMDGLIAGRAVEGLGGGGLIILAQATIADIIPPRQRGKYMGVMGSVFAVSTVVGPLLGGWFVQVTGWRWLFAFNIPLALLAIGAVAFFLTNPERRDDRPPVDVGGMMAMAVSVSSLVLATAWGGTLFPWASWQIIGLFALFLAAAVAFVLVERRAKEPIIPMLLFKNRNFVVCTVTGMFIMLGMMGTVSYLPTYFQIVDGLAPEQAGLMTFPMMAGVLLTAVGTGFLATKTGRYKWMPIASCAVAAVGFVLLSRLTPDTSLLVTGVFLFLSVQALEKRRWSE